jgi:hypothetical protein
LTCDNDDNSSHSADSFDTALNIISKGRPEFAEFQLDSIGSSVKELINLTDQISRNQNSDYASCDIIEDAHEIAKDDLLIQTSSCLKLNFVNINSELASSIASKTYEVVNNIMQHSLLISTSLKSVSLFSTPARLNSLMWHADFSPIQFKTVELNEVSVLIPLKGPGTKFCELSHVDREEYNIIQYMADPEDDNYMDSARGKFLTKACADNNNIFQAKPAYGSIYNSNKDLSAIHSAPDFNGERLALRVDFSIRS